jgi:hypothetical protein
MANYLFQRSASLPCTSSQEDPYDPYAKSNSYEMEDEELQEDEEQEESDQEDDEAREHDEEREFDIGDLSEFDLNDEYDGELI